MADILYLQTKNLEQSVAKTSFTPHLGQVNETAAGGDATPGLEFPRTWVCVSQSCE